ncbi:MAG: hypothetical protein MK209_10040 [Planctomycetes bacterium]|nr:hypothetical protein [Planctomycetota bacterium]
MKKIDPLSLIIGAAFVFLLSMAQPPKEDQMASAITLLADATNNQTEALTQLAQSSADTKLSGKVDLVLQNHAYSGGARIPFEIKQRQ